MNVWAKLIMEQNYVELARYVDRPELIHGVIQLFGQQLQVFRQLNREQLMQALRDLHWLSGEDGDWHLTTAAYAVLVAAMLGEIGREAPCAEYVAKMAENVILEKNGGLSYGGNRILADASVCEAVLPAEPETEKING